MAKDTYTELMKCEKPQHFVKFALKRGALVRSKNHHVVTHQNGDTSVFSCTPGKALLHKTRTEYKRIYLLDNDE